MKNNRPRVAPDTDAAQHAEFDTVVGKVRFAPNGEWAKTRVLMVQYQGIEDNELETFTKQGTRVVLYPDEWVSGTLNYPYAE